MPNAPSSHLQAPFLRYPNGGQASPLGSMGISKIQIANRYIRAPLPLKCPPSLLHDPAHVLPICLSVDESPRVGTEPKKSFEAWPRTVPLYGVVTRGKCPRHQMGLAPWSCPASKALVKIEKRGWFPSRLEKRAARNMLCGMVSW